jgi:lysine 2,3-aminomutase
MYSPLRSVADLVDAGLLRTRTPALERVAERYPVAITPEVAALIDPADPEDPIGLQFLPDARELDVRPEELADPIGDGAYSPAKGLVHRHPDRVLLKPVHACPIYCRFCFRREFVGPGGESLTADELAAALAYIESHSEIWEVILTGGDPLMLSPRRITELVKALTAIDHVKVLRWHSRVPIVDPGRISTELVEALGSRAKSVWMAIHCNHPRELTAAAAGALARLADSGVVLVSQTVLLRGVNDSADVLDQLMRRFVELGVRPYYLHHLDLAPGTSRFRLSLAEGRVIMRALRGRLSGVAQPTYVLDIPEGYGKVPIGPSYVEDSLGRVIIRDAVDTPHSYPDV